MAPTATPALSSRESEVTNEPFSEATGSLRGLDAKALWRNSAPSAVREAWRRGDHEAAWTAWREHLAQRSDDRASDPARLCWGLKAAESERLTQWIDSLRQARDESDATDALGRWFGGSAGELTPLAALEALALADAAPRLAGLLDAEDWWRLVEALRHLAEEAANAPPADADEPDRVVVGQLLAGELPLVLSRHLSELRPLEELAAPSRDALSDGLEGLTDGEGLLAAQLWIDGAAASLLIACWTRCLAAAGGRKPWSADAQLQYEWLARQALRIADREGRLAFTAEPLAGAAELLRAALAAGGDPSDESAAVERLRRFRGDDSFEPPSPSNHSEWAELGVLASGWRDKAPRIVVAHPDASCRVEVYSGKQRLIAGEWPVEVEVDGQRTAIDDTWDCQCWYSDEECDYLELALQLEGGGTLERQFFLAREDGVGFLADVFLSGREAPSKLRLASRLPLGEGVSLRPERETRDAVLTADGEAVAGLVPLSLAEWRDDPRGGELTAEGGSLLLTREHEGLNIASHLWIDFAPKRFAKQRTWRRLTVAESLKNVSSDVAVAYRVQAAKQQWLVYRSLTPAGNRTVLGQNLSSEALVGRFVAPDGTIDEYLEIEGGEED
ncbi:hypothetical protein [Botrimarina sp.]|uniref:hypothetical protein n=1 Tax=Botrimarina sp. TaxID=2795802 RepID=UPI0032EFE0AF